LYRWRPQLGIYDEIYDKPKSLNLTSCQLTKQWHTWRSGDRASWHILIIKPTRWTNFSNLFFGIKFSIFRTVPLSIIRSFSLYTQQRYMSYRFADSLRAGSGRISSVLILLASCQHTCMTYTIAVFTVKTSWWWTEELYETCRVFFQKWIWEISSSILFCYKKQWQVIIGFKIYVIKSMWRRSSSRW